jgi:hypothetical protein
MPTLVVGMLLFGGVAFMPTTSVGMAPVACYLSTAVFATATTGSTTNSSEKRLT